ncbi:hypothetical protein LEP1GSC193_2776 [Leptospira alstonii serovar Pingchang str. 80-412]|uniref:Uncharacterized protein n=1 Tax=Leptospira alstonii serovar Pingchang str. 80-412 TaxID=1218564 RepID=T0FN80_9LEPT|nr:hypothetical protein LEP1GSC193_2776 [Leptospira alstonii serovar Pingchang str. 80-412]
MQQKKVGRPARKSKTFIYKSTKKARAIFSQSTNVESIP